MKKKDRRYKYPWDKWFKRRRFVLRKDIDYQCQTHSMGVQIRWNARRCGVHISVAMRNDTIAVEVYHA